MRKAVGIFLILCLVCAFGALAGEKMGKGKWHGGKKGMMSKMAMMHKMMDKSMVATSDGGVVVMIGNKLLKYDKKLKLKGEAKIEIDIEEMMADGKALKAKIKDMMSHCDMEADSAEAEEEAEAEAEEAAEEVEE